MVLWLLIEQWLDVATYLGRVPVVFLFFLLSFSFSFFINNSQVV
jgi:hypothetical protein